MSETSKPGPIEPIDLHLGTRIHRARVDRAMSRVDLARAIGLSEPQVEKVEKGANRLFANKLFGIAVALEYPIGWFFEGFHAGRAPTEMPETVLPTDKASQDMLRNYAQLTPENQRLVRSMCIQLGKVEPAVGAEEA